MRRFHDVLHNFPSPRQFYLAMFQLVEHYVFCFPRKSSIWFIKETSLKLWSIVLNQKPYVCGADGTWPLSLESVRKQSLGKITVLSLIIIWVNKLSSYLLSSLLFFLSLLLIRLPWFRGFALFSENLVLKAETHLRKVRLCTVLRSCCSLEAESWA